MTETFGQRSPTPRERELILLIGRGLPNKEIANELSISKNTVRVHIGNIMRKYGLHNRTQIAVMFRMKSAATTTETLSDPSEEKVLSRSPGPVVST
jgi:DNA-binding NarL/FixJ family response regulator